MGSISHKITVAPSVARSRSYASWRRFARNPKAFPVASHVSLTFRSKAPAQPLSGRQLLDILSGLRAGDLSVFSL